METKKELMRGTALACILLGGAISVPAQGADRPEGPCDIYAAASTPCAAAHSTTRALYASYNGPLYQIVRASDGKTKDIGIVQPKGKDGGGYANAAAQDVFCKDTHCAISIIYDQSGKHNDLKQAPRGGFAGPSLGGYNNLPLADMAPITIMGHKAYGVFIAPGMGLRQNDPIGTAVDDQAEGMYWVIDGSHFNNGCCFDYGNGEIDSRDDGNGTMETLYFGNSTGWIHGVLPGPWIMTDQENNLVGCVNDDGSKLCPDLPAVQWRFATAMAKGKPHRWAMMVGDAQKPNSLKVTYDGKRVNGTYDPMRLQGAILLGNGGDNSNGSQGTFYEGAMTAAGTYPSAATEKKLQANIVAAGYGLPMLTVTPTGAVKKPTGLQTFTTGSTAASTVTFTNTTGKAVKGLRLALKLPKGWKAKAAGSAHSYKSFSGEIAPGQSVAASFTVTSGKKAFNGDIVARASWKSGKATAAEKVRNTAAIKINEFRVSDGTANKTNGFIELYNAGDKAVDLSGWRLTEHANHLPVFSSITLPKGTKLAPDSYYLLGQSNAALSVPAKAKDSVLYVSDTTGMKVGDSLTIGSGKMAETRKIAAIGSAASPATPLWQPAETPWLSVPKGSTNVPVTNTAGFKVGQKIAIGYGNATPVTGHETEKYEVATVTKVGKPGTQAYLEVAAPAGSSVLQTEATANFSIGDTFRLDINSKGHGIETVTVKAVGTAAQRSYVVAGSKPGATTITVGSKRDWWGGYAPDYAAGKVIDIGTPGNLQRVTITKATPKGRDVVLSLSEPLKAAHIPGEFVVMPGTGITLEKPLKYAHAANLPISNKGTGISFTPATRFPHLANEPVVALGGGITLDAPLAKDHPVDAAVLDLSVKTAGYQGKHAPDQWFGGPILSLDAGSMVLRDASGHVADSLNYGHYANNGNLVDAWAAEGYQAESGEGKGGCFIVTPGSPIHFPQLASVLHNASAGRFPDGQDTDSNCTDFTASAGALLLSPARPGSLNLKVSSVIGFKPGQSIYLGAPGKMEKAMIDTVGTGGAAMLKTAVDADHTIIDVSDIRDMAPNQTITIGAGRNLETATIIGHEMGPAGPRAILKAPLKYAHAAGEPIFGTGITLKAPLKTGLAANAQLVSDLPTPGAPNLYQSAQK